MPQELQSNQLVDFAPHFLHVTGPESGLSAESLPFSLAPRVHRPDHLLAPLPAQEGAGIIETLHAGSLFFKDQQAFCTTREAIESCKRSGLHGASAVYGVGIWQQTAFTEMAVRYFSRFWPTRPEKQDWIKGSCFSIDDYLPNTVIGGRDGLRAFAASVKEQAKVDLIVCLLPGSTGVGGRFARERPDLLVKHSAETFADSPEQQSELKSLQEISAGEPAYQDFVIRKEGASPGRHVLKVFEAFGGELFVYRYDGADKEQGRSQTIYIQRRANEHPLKHAYVVDAVPGGEERTSCVRLASENPCVPHNHNHCVFIDQFQLDTSNPETAKAHAARLAPYMPLSLRADLGHLVDRSYWPAFLKALRAQDAAMPPRFMMEFYGTGHEEVQSFGIAPYAKYPLDWIRGRDLPPGGSHGVSVLMNHVFSGGADLFRRSVGFSENHDEEGDQFHPRRFAELALIGSLPFGHLLLGQGQRYAVDRRYGADMWVPKQDYIEHCRQGIIRDAGYFMAEKRLLHALSRAVFRSADSEILPSIVWVKGCNPAALFNCVRRYSFGEGEEDMVLSVVLNDGAAPAAAARVDLTRSFGIEEKDLDRYCMVSLLSGKVEDAKPLFELPLSGYDVHLWALMPRARVLSALESF